MATDDKQVLVTGKAPTPATFKIPGNGQLQPKSVYASFDGSGASGDFKPALKIFSDAGEVVGVYPTDDTVTAGGSVDVSWGPFLGRKGGGATAPTLAYARAWNDQFSGDSAQTVNAGATVTAAFAHTETTDSAVVSFRTSSHTNDTADLLAHGSYLLYVGSHWDVVDDGVTSLIYNPGSGENAFPHLPLNPTTNPASGDGIGTAQSQDFAARHITGSPGSENVLLGNRLAAAHSVNQCYFVIVYLGTG